MAQTETSAESDKGQTRTSSGQGGRVNIRNARNNTRDSSASTSRYYKRGIETFGAVLALKYDKLELKKYFDVFRVNLINYIKKGLTISKDILVLVQAMEDPKASFDTKNEPKDLNEAEDKSEVKKSYTGCKSKSLYWERGEICFKHENNLLHHMGTVYSSTRVSFEGK